MEKTIMLGCVDATAWGYSPNARAIAYVTVKYEEKKRPEGILCGWQGKNGRACHHGWPVP